MTKCFSFTGTGNRILKTSFANSGLRSTKTDLGDGTTMHCWIPKRRDESKPNLVLVHGFGANAMWQWTMLIKRVVPRFNVYVPDLLFFGDSYTTRTERSDSFQAQCVMRVLTEAHKLEKMYVVGVSYGGFVAYCMAAQFRDVVERAVICCAGVCLEEEDLKNGMFEVQDVNEAANILVPQTPNKLKELMGFAFRKTPKVLPSCLLRDFIDEMYTEHIQEMKELLFAVPQNRKLSNLPKITQPTLILWGEHDKIFPVALAHRLKSHLGENAKLVIMKNVGHGFTAEKHKEFYRHLKSFLVNFASEPTSSQEQKISKEPESNHQIEDTNSSEVQV